MASAWHPGRRRQYRLKDCAQRLNFILDGSCIFIILEDYVSDLKSQI